MSGCAYVCQFCIIATFRVRLIVKLEMIEKISYFYDKPEYEMIDLMGCSITFSVFHGKPFFGRSVRKNFQEK